MNLKVQRELAAVTERFFVPSLKGHSFQGRFLVTAGKKMLYSSSEKDKKVSLGSYELVSLTSVPEKVMERILLEYISEHMKEEVTGKS